ncbi:MAG: DUF2254 domain-containing protein [Thermoleophilia bacterium]|nr:DUF2254 domain-containing protein [Thermoleophilia bacterium]
MHRRRPSLENLTERIRASLWFTPTVMVAVSLATLALLLRLDEQQHDLPELLAFSGDPKAARDIASTIAGAMMGFIGVVFSITVVALQLASSQFSPRALRGFLRDRLTKVTLGAYVSTLAYALLLIRHVDGSGVVVPDLAMTGLFVLTLGSIALFIAYIDHISHSIRAVNIIETIAAELRSAIVDDLRPYETEPLGIDPSHDPFSDDGPLLHHDAAGAVLVHVDRSELANAARRHGCVIELLVRGGSFVRAGAAVARVHGLAPGAQLPAAEVAAAMSFDVERTMQDDLSFGLRQLVDIALRALSPGVNDPTTAVQAIDRIHDALALLATRADPDPWIRGDDGHPRAWIPVASWSDRVSLALDEIRVAGRGSLQVQRRLLALLDDLLEHAPAGRRPPLQTQRDAVERAVLETFPDPLDRAAAATADMIGIG